ncbi:sulfurtransferase [Actinophytocola sp.]|uniref:sulfurtransferase n=1 Tax=Actinophytocola sp. TaxID=1872138 RepID=UPI00389A3EC9
MTSPLVSTTDLAASLSGDEPPVLLDVRWRLGGPPGREDYARGHLPGAVFLDLDADLAAPPGPAGRHPLPEPADLQRVLRAAGVRDGAPVVVYDADNGSIAARLWWLLRWGGHAQVRVLDGGYAAWQAEGRPVTTDVPAPERGDITVRPGHMPVVDADGAATLARTGVLLDARAPERYRGDVEPIDPKGGHVPGARNAPFAAHTGADGRWRTPEELAAHFAKVGVPAKVDGPEVGVSGEAGVPDKVGGSEAGLAGEVGVPDGVGGSEVEVSGKARVHHKVPEAEVEVPGEVGGPEVRAPQEVGVPGKAGMSEKGEAYGESAAQIGAYCGSGVTATSVVLALEIAGITRPDAPATLYAGSWSNWSADPARPVATGDEPA